MRKIRSIYLSRCVLLLFIGYVSVNAQEKAAIQLVTTAANVPAEISFTSQMQYSDPFNEIEMDVVFTNPSGAAYRVPAFWAGGNTWKVRYASPQTGEHKWWTECSNKLDDGLNDVMGRLTVVTYNGNNALYNHGPVRVAPDKRHFEYTDGTPFFWLGDTWWFGLSKRLHYPDEFAQLASDRKDKGFNVIQLVAGLFPDMYSFDERGVNEAGFPWEKDYKTIRPEYYDSADMRITYLVDQGFTPCIVGAWGYYFKWMGEAKLKAHWRYIVARYGAYPVIWSAGGEVNLPFYREENFPFDDQVQAAHWCNIMRYIKTIDPWRRPLTTHPTAINSYTARHSVDDPSLLDFDFLQTPHMGDMVNVELASLNTVIQSRAADPVMPVINGECTFEMLLDKTLPEKPRHLFWLCMLNGAAGHTYGANGIWQLNRKDDPHGPSPTASSPKTGYGTITWEEAMHLDGGRQVAAGKVWLSKLPWWTFKPHFSWVTWAEQAGVVAPCAIGVYNGYRVYYMIEAKSVILRQLKPFQTYKVKYFDPVNCVETNGENFTADKKGETKIAPPQPDNDWVLLVEPI